MLLVVLILSFILSTFFPFVNSFPMHFVAQPITFIFSSITPYVYPESCYLIIDPISFVVTSIPPKVLTFSIFFTFFIISFVFITVCPQLSTKSMLQVILPITLVFSSIMCNKYPIPIRFSIFPYSLIKITIRINKLSLTIRLIGEPVPFINSTIRPCLNSESLPHLAFPFAFICYSIGHNYCILVNQLIVSFAMLKMYAVGLFKFSLNHAQDTGSNYQFKNYCDYLFKYGFEEYSLLNSYYIVSKRFPSANDYYLNYIYNTPVNQKLLLMQNTFFKFTETFNDNGTVWYTIQVHGKGNDPQPIIIKERYRQLRQFHQKCLTTPFKNDIPDFPPKKLIGSTKQQFIQKRKKQLQNYYNTLSKTVDIQKLPELNKFIEKHRKVKKEKPEETHNKTKQDDNKLQVKFKKQSQLKTVFQNAYKQVLVKLVDLSKDFYPMMEMNHDDSLRRLTSEIQAARPSQSALLSDFKVQGLEENETDFWSMFLKDEHQQFLSRSASMLKTIDMIQKQVGNSEKQTIVLVK